MPVESIINSFSAGELSPSVYGRTDLQQYNQGAASLSNMLVQPSGSARKRPGTKKLDTITNTTEISDFGKLGSFQMASDEGRAVLLTSQIIRSYDSDGNVDLDTTPPVTVTSAIARSIKSVQTKLDAVYVGRDVRPYRLTNNGSGALTGPTAIPIAPPQLNLTFAVTTANKRPGAVSAVDERLVFGGTNEEPNAIFGSAVKALDSHINSYNWTSSSGTVTETASGDTLTVKAGAFLPAAYTSPSTITTETDLNFYANNSNAADTAPYAFEVLDNAFIDILWLAATNTIQNGFIIAGTAEGVYALSGSGTGGAIVPSGLLRASKLSAAGCADVQGIVAGSYLVFVDSSKRKLRVAQFSLEADAFNTPRLNDFADHLFDADIREVHYQRAPNDIIWVLLENGKLLAFSYDQATGLAAWTPMAFGNDDVTVTVESVAILHEGEEDVVVLLMKSVSGATTTWTLEKMTAFSQEDQDEFWYVDSGVRKTSGDIVGVTLTGTDPVSIEVTAHGYVTGDILKVEDVVGTVELNDNVYTITVTDADNFTLDGTDSSNFTAYTSGGTVKPQTVSSLDHLEGETVQVWLDGAAHPPREVSSGQISLARNADVVIVGRPFTATVTTLPVQEQQDKVKRASRAFVRFLDTLGAKAGETEFEEIVPFREGDFVMGARPSLFTGIKEIPYFGRHDRDAQVSIFSDTPTPFHILSVTTRLELYG